MITLVDKGLGKKYLKEVWDIQNDILKLDISNEMNIEVKSIFEILDSEMENKFIYAIFAIFKVIEMINYQYTEEKYKNNKRDAYWINTEIKLECKYTMRSDTSENKIRLILDRKLSLTSKELHQNISDINRIRNNTIHPKKGIVEIPTKENILTWFKMLQTILEEIDK